MILFNLVCQHDHQFEAWFRDGAAYDALTVAGEIACPLCGVTQVRKAPMAPSLVKGGRGERAAAEAAKESPSVPATTTPPAESPVAAVTQALTELRRQIEASCDYVGKRFPDEARRIHHGEAEERPIYGEASRADAEALRDEGVDIVAVPWLRRHDS